MTHRSKPDVRLRPFGVGDLERVAALWRTCGLVVPYNDPAEDIAFCRASPTAELFVAEDGDVIVASAMAGHDGHRGWLYYVATDPSRRGEGLGRRIVAHAEAWLAAQGVRKINLMIRENNAQALDFYQRVGYEVTPRLVMGRWLADTPN